MDIRENKGSVSCHATHDQSDSQTVRNRRYGIGFGAERAGQQAQKDRWTGRGSHSSYSLFRSAGRPGAVDAAADCGRTGAPWGRGEYFRHSNDGNTEKNELSSVCLNPCLPLGIWPVRSTLGLYTEILSALPSIGDFLPLTPDASSENFIPLSYDF